MVDLVFQVNPPRWKKNLRWVGGGLGGLYFSLGPGGGAA